MLRRAEAVGSTTAPRDLAFAVLADHGRYSEWLPGLAKADVLAREGDVVVLEIQAPRLAAGPIVLELIHSPPAEIRFHQVGHYGKPRVAGRCELHETGGGTRLCLEIGFRSALLRLADRRRLREGATRAVTALARRCDDVEAGQLPPPGGRRKVLEILERDGGLEIRLHAERFRLVRADDTGAPR